MFDVPQIMKAEKLATDEQPREVVGAPMAAAKKNGAPAVAGKLNSKVNILLVDDRHDKLLALEAILGGLNQNLVMARSGKEALRLLLKQEFAVILLDVSMPGMDGFETASLIRQRPSTERTPIIFVTGVEASRECIARGYSLGAVDYMVTPIVPEVLRAKVSVFVSLHKQAELIKRQSEQVQRLNHELERR